MCRLSSWQIKIDSVIQSIICSISHLERIYVGYSGGLDSSCLLHMLYKAVDGRIPISAIHINHNLQADAAVWEDFCRKQVQSYDNVEINIESVTVINQGEGIEAEARKLRYHAFKSVIHHSEKSSLYLAHHGDDQAETFIMRLMRGAGLLGMQCMSTASKMENLNIQRPLLGLTKRDLEKYAEINHIGHIDDGSNNDNRLDRNYVRHEVMPVIKKRWPTAYHSIQKTIDHMESDWSILQKYANQLLASVSGRSYGLSTINIAALNQLALSERSLVIRVFCTMHGWYVPPAKRLKTLIEQLENATATTKVSLKLRQYKMIQYKNLLYIMPAQWFTEYPDEMILNLKHLPEYIRMPNKVKVHWESIESALNERVGQTVQLTFKGTRKLNPAMTKSLKRRFQENHVPSFMRKHWPIVIINSKAIFVEIEASTC